MQRIGWSDVPEDVRRLITRALDAEVVAVSSVEGGFSPCLAGPARLGDGRTVFLKAVSPAQNPDSPEMLRRELDAAARLPAEVPAPAVLAVVDDGDWVAGAFEYVDGTTPRVPWQPAELRRALDTVGAVGTVSAPDGLPSAAERLTPVFRGWQALRAADDVPPGWWVDRLDELVDLEAHALEVLDGDRLVHNDVRSDNLVVDGSGRMHLVDWAHPAAGPAWLDVVLWLPALELEGGGPPEEVLDALGPLGVDGDALTAVVAGCAGYFLHRGTLPDPPGLPTVRAFQRAQAGTSLAWLARLLRRA